MVLDSWANTLVNAAIAERKLSMLDVQKTFKAIGKGIEKTKVEIKQEEVSLVQSIAAGTAFISGLENAQMDEILQFEHNVLGKIDREKQR